MIYQLLACFYLILKVEKRVEGLSFRDFLGQIVRLPEYKALRIHLSPTQPCDWDNDLYMVFERHILQTLRFKTDYLSTGDVIYLTVCTFAETNSEQKGEHLDKLL